MISNLSPCWLLCGNPEMQLMMASYLSLTDLALCFHLKRKVTAEALAQMPARDLVAET